MEFQDIFLNLLGSAIVGIFAGLAVHWSYHGIHFLDQGLKFRARYLGKYPFIFLFLFTVIWTTSTLIFIFLKLF